MKGRLQDFKPRFSNKNGWIREKEINYISFRNKGVGFRNKIC